MNLLQKINKLEKNMNRTLYGSFPVGIERYRYTEPENEVAYMGGIFSYNFWRVTPDGFLSTLLSNVGRQATFKLGLENIDIFQMKHRHEYVEMGYVCKGRLDMEISDNPYSFQENEAFFINSNCVHSEKLIGADNAIIFIGMSDEIFDEIFLQKLEDEQPLYGFIRANLRRQKNKRQFIRFTPRGNHKLLENLINHVTDEVDLNSIGSDYIIKGLMLRIMDLLFTSFDTHLTSIGTKQKNEVIFLEIEKYLSKNYQHCTISNLVSKYHYNEDYFTKLIKQHANMTFSQFLQEIRLRKAEEMLVASSLPITRIIEDVGYENKSYFYRLFAKRNGVRPEEYRLNHKK
jgi:AraC-like DNA-binding protein/mannose-6-phosphate isomerase-like protein (cupin superfamily)